MGPLMRVGVQFICMNTSLAASHTTPSMSPGTSTEYRLDSAISTCQTIPCSEQDKVRASSVVGSIPPRAIPSHPAVLPTPRTQCSSTTEYVAMASWSTTYRWGQEAPSYTTVESIFFYTHGLSPARWATRLRLGFTAAWSLGSNHILGPKGLMGVQTATCSTSRHEPRVGSFSIFNFNQTETENRKIL